MKLIDKFKNSNIHMDAHNTVINFDRSKSDLAPAKVSSSMAAGGIGGAGQVAGANNNSS